MEVNVSKKVEQSLDEIIKEFRDKVYNDTKEVIYADIFEKMKLIDAEYDNTEQKWNIFKDYIQDCFIHSTSFVSGVTVEVVKDE